MSINREKLTQQFLKEYEKLNSEQQSAVNQIEGPVMVIAGPGTGKTQILASRIGKILLETDVSPENILCLTYTDAGVVAMRRRLLQFIGPDAYKVGIYTFHAFCNDVIQENLSLFEKTALDPVSDLEKIEMLKELVDQFPKNHPLKRYRGDVYYEITNLKQLFSDMKREGWTSVFLNQKIEEYIQSLELRDEYIYKRKQKEFNAGDKNVNKIAEEVGRMEKLRAAVNEFDTFQQMMKRRNRYDFEDMINWVITAFEENNNLLSNYQERYQYILVDEYQDTSGTQNRLVELLISFWDRPNVFVVGDDDQSIYRFQGANIENMNQFMNSYSDLLVVVLEKNYRSTQPILNVSKALIERNRERLIHTRPDRQLTKELLASNIAILHLEHSPVFKQFESQRAEMIGIASEIEQLVAEGTEPGRIAVIYKENKYGEELAQYFKLLQLPVYSKRHQNILEIPVAKKILLVLKYIAAEHDVPYGGDEMLFEILHFNWFNIPSLEIAKLSVEVAGKQFSDDKTSLRRLLSEKAKEAPKDLFSQGLHPALKKASAIVEKLITDSVNVTLQQLFENVIREAGVVNHIMQSPDKHWQLQVVTGLFDFVKDETRRNPFMNLEKLTNIIELMEHEELKLPLVQVSGSDKGINLLTAHGSKGLEFEHIFLTGCNSSLWEKKRKPSGGYSLPDTIWSSNLPEGKKSTLQKQKDEEELRRLFYVALTRAEKHLHISFSRYKNDGKELEPSMFIAEIRDQHPEMLIEPTAVTDDQFVRFASIPFGEMAPEIGKLEKEFVERLLEKFVMNVTALNNYLKCPLEFYFKNLVRIPSPKNEATEFGSSVHFALEQLFHKLQASGTDTFPSKQTFIGDFEWYMHRHRESFTQEQFDRRLEYGQEVLSNYYDKYINGFNKIVAIERNIRNVVLKGVPLKGKLDKLEFDGKSVNVVDYKTGDHEKALKKLKPPNEKDPNGGDYWRQAVFYKILVDNYGQKDWKVVSTEFDFIEPDKKKQYRREKLVIAPEDITTVTQQIEDVWQKIQAHEFYTGCGKDKCHWCNFVKTNDLQIALHEVEEPEEENELF
ncbi:MAG: ATP-dependent helicase [Chitinophagaceae bacterium]|nr:ATP-dependent helicase [Chitinophagaceae bacterium]